MTAMHFGAMKKQLEALQWLFAHAVNITDVDTLGRTPLHFAVVAVSTPCVHWLLTNGADPRAAHKVREGTQYIHAC